MSLIRHYARASGDPRVIADVAATLQANWDPAQEFQAPDGTCEPKAHAATILGMLATGGDTAAVNGYLRRTEETALGTARSSSHERRNLSRHIWQMLQDAAVAAAKAATDLEAAT
jgi:hypothetical protein